MRALMAFLLMAATLVALVGCNNRSIVGTWNGSQAGVPAEMTFGSDGSLKVVATAGGLSITGDGTYKMEGDKLTMTMTSMNVPGLDLIPGAKEQMDSFLNKPNEVTVVWVSDKELKVTNDTGEQTWTRKETS